MSRLQDALGQIADTQRTALGLVMNLGADTINFEFDKADLKPADRELLSRIVGVLMTSTGYRIQVLATPTMSARWPTTRRCRNSALKRSSITWRQLASIGRSSPPRAGKTPPLAEGVSEAARARNRRIELGIIDTVVNYSEEAPPNGKQQH